MRAAFASFFLFFYLCIAQIIKQNKMHNKEKSKLVVRLLSLAVAVLVLAAGAILRDGKLFGHDLSASHATPSAAPANSDTLAVQPDGSIIVSTKAIAKDIQGYGGPVPLKLHIDKSGVVTAVEAEPNSESPDFFNHAKTLLTHWQGKTVDAALADIDKVDGVSGATFSSKAIIGNMKRGLAYAKQYSSDANGSDDASAATTQGSAQNTGWTVGGIAAIVVVLLGAVVPLLIKSRRWHYVQLALNVVVLGLWTGTFVSYAMFMRLFAGGVSLATIGTLAAPLLMTAVALLYPLAGKPGHYCAHVCPFGSAQELAGKLTRRKPRISPRLNRVLTTLRSLLWGVLMALMLTGTWTVWMDYELFTAFLYSSASIVVILLAVAFLVLSVWVPRPYCRFVCPTGMIIRN